MPKQTMNEEDRLVYSIMAMEMQAAENLYERIKGVMSKRRLEIKKEQTRVHKILQGPASPAQPID